MAKKIDSQKVMLDHSEAKVKLLGKYLDRYLNIISNDGYTKKIDVFDLFCGEGLYDNGGQGSPLVILENLRQLHEDNKGKIKTIPPINIYLNDLKKSKTDKVERIVNERKLHDVKYGTLKYSNKDYKQIIPKLAAYTTKLKNEKAFIFIDPYGYKEIRASEIKSLLKAKKTEVLLFLPTQFMYRFDEKGTPESLIELLDDLVHYENWKPNDSVFQFIEQFKDAFKLNLGSDFFVDTFTIQKDRNTVFCLFFFSSHIRGFEKMLEAKWEIDSEAGKGWKFERSGNLFTSFKTNPLQDKLLNLLANNSYNNKEIYSFTLHSGFLPKHMNDILSDLQEKNKISVILNNGEKARKNSFYINYESYRLDNYKVIIKLI
jgi:three-Cys-motif partner protein